MKVLFCLSLYTIFSYQVFSQDNFQISDNSIKSENEKKTPNSLFNADINYNLLGTTLISTKGVIGSQNSGIVIGYQFGSNFNSERINVYRLGYQRSIFSAFYSNITADWVRYKNNSIANNSHFSDCYRLNIGIGYTLGFFKSKRCYFNVEYVVNAISKDERHIKSLFFKSSQLAFGIGFRLGTPATTTYEGVKNVTTVPVKP